MKKLSLFMATLLAIVGCSHEQDLTPKITPRHFTASFENATTRTYLDDNFKLLWSADDRLTIFTSTLNEEYKFAGNTGDNSGKFTKISTGDFATGNAISTNYAVYPYAEDNALSNDEIITLKLPAEQNYAEDSFGLGANTMVAVTADTNDTFLPFKNLGGYLRLQLYGEGITIKSIILQGNNSEPLAGEASIVATYGSLPELTIAENSETAIKLNCGEGVTIGATVEDATEFWFVVPPTTFEGGFSITITDTEGKTMTKSTSKTFSIERNTFKTMNAFEVTTTLPSTIAAANEIIYTSTDNAAVTPYNTNAFGANITSNTYENGVGVITFDDSVTKIGANAFTNCTTLENIILSNGESIITRSATTTEGITSIDENAFSGCTSLTNITIPEGVATIGNNAFENCTSLSNISIPESVTSIGASAFSGCSALSEIPISNSVTEINDFAFYRCEELTSISLPEGIESIGEYAFWGCKALTSISLPNSLKYIGNDAFSNCETLTSISIPEGIESIREYTFGGCSALTNISLPNSLKSIGDWAFGECSALTNIDIPESITSIGNSAFISCIALKSITLPKYAPYMGEAVFSNCVALERVVLPPNITTISESTFFRCSSLASIDIPNTVTTIETYAFYDCKSLTNIVLPVGTTTIGMLTFGGCESLVNINIPNSVTSIGQNAFSNCTSLTNINLPNSITYIESGTFYRCGLKNINIPNTVTNIGQGAFQECLSLTSITLPESITSISTGAFQGCKSLTNINIPNGVTTIGDRAFFDCVKLASVYCKATTPPTLGIESFDYNAWGRRIYVPTGSLTIYKAANNWSSYADYITGYNF
ncbi:MAG: leucine-rich repeat protein [Alistipes sp.]|nr:leucine-rich repeat protein [Alistipes sp.]